MSKGRFAAIRPFFRRSGGVPFAMYAPLFISGAVQSLDSPHSTCLPRPAAPGQGHRGESPACPGGRPEEVVACGTLLRPLSARVDLHSTHSSPILGPSSYSGKENALPRPGFGRPASNSSSRRSPPSDSPARVVCDNNGASFGTTSSLNTSVPQQTPEQYKACQADGRVGDPDGRYRGEPAVLRDAGAAQHQRIVDEDNRHKAGDERR